MDYDRIERAIEFLVESQASLTAKVDANTEAIARLALEAEADRKVMRAAIGKMDTAIGEMHSAVDRMENAIEEMHQGVNGILLIAERLTNNVQVLGKAQQGTTQRIERLENRVQVVEDRLENS